MNIKLSERQLQNLLLFLNRVKYKGLEEVEAAYEIVMAINEALKAKDRRQLNG
jgi:hypothetical protein